MFSLYNSIRIPVQRCGHCGASLTTAALAALLFVVTVAGCGPRKASDDSTQPKLRVCADPNNMPFSNRDEEGLENKLAEIVAREMNREVAYTWFPQRRGFIRNTLRAEKCDVVMSIPSSFELAQPTDPYYRSTYVFVTRRHSDVEVTSLDDPALKDLRIGIHVIGDDYSNVPPAQALAKRGIINNVRGYTIYGDYSKPNPPADLLHALALGEIDLAIAWGPLAGYFASRVETPLEITPVSPQIDLPFIPFVFDISMGVRRDDDSLRARLDTVLHANRKEIDALLEEYGVPRVDGHRQAPTQL